jgi:hypothetical protein
MRQGKPLFGIDHDDAAELNILKKLTRLATPAKPLPSQRVVS